MQTIVKAFPFSVRNIESLYLVSCSPQVTKFPLLGSLARAFAIRHDNCGNIGIEESFAEEPYSYLIRMLRKFTEEPAAKVQARKFKVKKELVKKQKSKKTEDQEEEKKGVDAN